MGEERYEFSPWRGPLWEIEESRWQSLGWPCHLADPVGHGDSLLNYLWASGRPAVQLPQGPGERALNQPRPYPSSKIV